MRGWVPPDGQYQCMETCGGGGRGVTDSGWKVTDGGLTVTAGD